MPDTAKARPSLSVIVLSHGDLGRVPRPHKANGLLGTSALWGGGWLPLPLGVGAENLLLRGQAYTHCTTVCRAGVTEPNRTNQKPGQPTQHRLEAERLQYPS